MKIRTDFVTNSSSANYTVSLELISDNDERVWSGPITACADGDQSKELASSASYEGELPTISKDKTIDTLCEMLFEGVVIKGCYYDNTRVSDESDDDCEDKKFVVTGKLEYFENRDELVAYIEDLGGVVVGSVSKNTDYLICNDKTSTSSKMKKAQELNIPIISELEFITRFGDSDDFDIDIGEDEEWDEDFEPRDYNAKELYSDLLERIKKECREKGLNISSLDKIIIREDVYATGDDPIWDDILDEEYGGEKYKVSVYSATEDRWQTITLIEGETRNSSFRVLDQESASYKTLSPKDLEMTKKEYKMLTIEKAAEKWLEKIGINTNTASEKANLSTIHFHCDKEVANKIMAAFENIFAVEWKPLVERKKKIYEGCNTEYNPLTCIITKDGFDAVINIPLVPYIGEYYCENEMGEDPLDCAIEKFKSSYPNIKFNGHIKYVASLAYYFERKIHTGMGESADYDVSSDTKN